MTAASDIAADLQWVAGRWTDLHTARLKGTPRPWREPDELPTAVRAERDHLARVERIEADDRMPGFSPAPVHVDILDTLAELLMAADLLHEHVAQTVGHPTLAHPATAFADPGPYLAYVVELLPEACDTDPDMAEAAREKADDMRDLIASALGEILDGQRLKAVCPFCIGVTPTHPAGGAFTLRLRIIPDTVATEPDATEPVVVCENTCTPFAAEVGLWVLGRPAWRRPEWDWLAQRIDQVNDPDRYRRTDTAS